MERYLFKRIYLMTGNKNMVGDTLLVNKLRFFGQVSSCLELGFHLYTAASGGCF
jgi:hypothetical protein